MTCSNCYDVNLLLMSAIVSYSLSITNCFYFTMQIKSSSVFHKFQVLSFSCLSTVKLLTPKLISIYFLQKMARSKNTGYSLLAIVLFSCLASTFAYPNQMIQHQKQVAEQNEQPRPQYIPSTDDDRKFAEKPNALKKVALDDIDDDLQTNQLQDGGFSWSNMLGKFNHF